MVKKIPEHDTSWTPSTPADPAPESDAGWQYDAAPPPSQKEQVKAGHNSSNAELIKFVERYERLAEEADGAREDQKQLMLEVKGRGFDAAILKKVIARRKMDPNARADMDALIETYEAALDGH